MGKRTDSKDVMERELGKVGDWLSVAAEKEEGKKMNTRHMN